MLTSDDGFCSKSLVYTRPGRRRGLPKPATQHDEVSSMSKAGDKTHDFGIDEFAPRLHDFVIGSTTLG